MQFTGAANGPRRILLIGIGKTTDRPGALRRAAAIAARQATKLGTGDLAFHAGVLGEKEVEAVTVGLLAGSWAYKDLKTAPPEEERRAPLERATILAGDSEENGRGFSNGLALGAGHSLARTLAMMPGNICTPEFLAKTAGDVADRHSMKLTVLGRAEMTDEGMGSFLSVAQGTPQDPKLIAVEYSGGKPGEKPVVLVGKGLCFDSGGISIKPAQSMEDMKYDMCGAAGVLGALDAIGRMKLPINVVGLIGATTNMPSGTAVNPGDVVKSHLGKYIEIINTDAEGRLVLADVLSYARRFDPAVVIDAATLTGACVVALGHTASGVFGTDEALIARGDAAGKESRRAGMVDAACGMSTRSSSKSDVADIKNSGGRPAGAITAAMFSRNSLRVSVGSSRHRRHRVFRVGSRGDSKGTNRCSDGYFVEFVAGDSLKMLRAAVLVVLASADRRGFFHGTVSSTARRRAGYSAAGK
jgi:leucyl aminopeptidase